VARTRHYFHPVGSSRDVPSHGTRTHGTGLDFHLPLNHIRRQ
jgi:hypothetical protein